MVGTIARQVAEAEAAGARIVVVHTGNPDLARDFTDVRDTVRAYVSAAGLPAGAYKVEVRGSADRLAKAGGWAPVIPLEQTVADTLDYWREQV